MSVKKRMIIRIIAAILVVTFVAQDVVWANPKILERRALSATLQIPLLTGQLRAGDIKTLLEIKLQEIIRSMTLSELRKREYNLIVEERGVKFKINLKTDTEGRLAADCYVLTDNPISYSFIINDDLSTMLINDDVDPSGVERERGLEHVNISILPVKEGIVCLRELVNEKRKHMANRPVYVGIDGDAGVGKTTLVKSLVDSDNLVVIHADYFREMNALINWEKLKEEIIGKTAGKNNPVVIIEGYELFLDIGQARTEEQKKYVINIDFDIKVNLKADYDTKLVNLKNRHPDWDDEYLKDMASALQGHYAAITYDLILDNSIEHRFSPESEVKIINGAPAAKHPLGPGQSAEAQIESAIREGRLFVIENIRIQDLDIIRSGSAEEIANYFCQYLDNVTPDTRNNLINNFKDSKLREMLYRAFWEIRNSAIPLDSPVNKFKFAIISEKEGDPTYRVGSLAKDSKSKPTFKEVFYCDLNRKRTSTGQPVIYIGLNTMGEERLDKTGFWKLFDYLLRDAERNKHISPEEEARQRIITEDERDVMYEFYREITGRKHVEVYSRSKLIDTKRYLSADQVEALLIKIFGLRDGRTANYKRFWLRNTVEVNGIKYPYLCDNRREYFYRAGKIFVIDSNYRDCLPGLLYDSDAKFIFIDFRQERILNFIDYSSDGGYRIGTLGILIALQNMDLKDKVVVDAGAGNGILGIAAAVLGARRVISLEGVEKYRGMVMENAVANGVSDRVDFKYFGSTFQALALRAKQDGILEKVDIILANIPFWGLPFEDELSNDKDNLISMLLTTFPCRLYVTDGEYMDVGGDAESLKKNFKNMRLSVEHVIELRDIIEIKKPTIIARYKQPGTPTFDGPWSEQPFDGPGMGPGAAGPINWDDDNSNYEKTPVSVIILTYNEEKNIEECLKSVCRWADEVIVVDSYSTDKTLEIAGRYTDKIYQHRFEDYSKQRNWAQNNVPLANKWVLHLDADERVSLELTGEIRRAVISATDDISGFIMTRRHMFRGRWIRHGGMYPTYHLRLFRKDRGRCEDRLYDQHFICEGNVLRIKGDILEQASENLRDWIKRLNRWAEVDARESLRSNEIRDVVKARLFGNPIERRRWLKNNIYLRLPLFIRPFLYFIYRYVFRLGFLDGKEGFIYHFFQGFWFRFMIDLKIYEYSRKVGPKTKDPPGPGAANADSPEFTGDDIKQSFSELTPQLIKELQEERRLVRKIHRRWREAITTFGSARIPPSDPIYAKAKEFGAAIYRAGLAIRTGAGPSLMEAPLQGYIEERDKAREEKSTSNITQGIRIELPFEQKTSKYVEDNYTFKHFVDRKMALYDNCLGIAVFPGGFGTYDELFEVWFRQLPVVLIGKDYWEAIINTIYERWDRLGWLEKVEYRPFITDSVDEAVEYLRSTTGRVIRESSEMVEEAGQDMESSLIELSKWPSAVTIIGQSEFTDKKEADIIAQIASHLISSGVPVRSGTANHYLKVVLETAAKERTDMLQAVLAVPAGTAVTPVRNRIFTNHISNHHILLFENSRAFVFLPGRVKTLSRLFDIIAIMQTGKVPKRPIVLIGREFWQPIKDAIVKAALNYPAGQLIKPEDANLLQIADTADEALKYIGFVPLDVSPQIVTKHPLGPGAANADSPEFKDEDFAKNIERRLIKDPLIIALREAGIDAVLDIANQIDPSIGERAIKANNQFLVISEVLGRDDVKKYVYERLWRLAEEKGWVMRAELRSGEEKPWTLDQDIALAIRERSQVTSGDDIKKFFMGIPLEGDLRQVIEEVLAMYGIRPGENIQLLNSKNLSPGDRSTTKQFVNTLASTLDALSSSAEAFDSAAPRLGLEFEGRPAAHHDDEISMPPFSPKTRAEVRSGKHDGARLAENELSLQKLVIAWGSKSGVLLTAQEKEDSEVLHGKILEVYGENRQLQLRIKYNRIPKDLNDMQSRILTVTDIESKDHKDFDKQLFALVVLYVVNQAPEISMIDFELRKQKIPDIGYETAFVNALERLGLFKTLRWGQRSGGATAKLNRDRFDELVKNIKTANLGVVEAETVEPEFVPPAWHEGMNQSVAKESIYSDVNVRKVLIVHFDGSPGIGDQIVPLALPHLLRRKFGNIQIDYLAQYPDIVKGQPVNVLDIRAFRKGMPLRTQHRQYRLREDNLKELIENERYDLVVDFDRWVNGRYLKNDGQDIGVPLLIAHGTTDDFSFRYKKFGRWNSLGAALKQNRYERYGELFHLMELQGREGSSLPRLSLGEREVAVDRARHILEKMGIKPDKPIILVNPITSAAVKEWSLARWEEFFKRIAVKDPSVFRNYYFIVNRGPKEQGRNLGEKLGALVYDTSFEGRGKRFVAGIGDIIEQYLQQTNAKSYEPRLPHMSLREFMALVSLSSGVFTMDTGTSHVAISLGVPAHVVFVHLAPEEWRPPYASFSFDPSELIGKVGDQEMNFNRMEFESLLEKASERFSSKGASQGARLAAAKPPRDKLGDGPKGASQAPVAGPAAAQAAGVSQSGTSPSIYPYIIDSNTAEIRLATAGEDAAIKEEPKPGEIDTTQNGPWPEQDMNRPGMSPGAAGPINTGDEDDVNGVSQSDTSQSKHSRPEDQSDARAEGRRKKGEVNEEFAQSFTRQIQNISALGRPGSGKGTVMNAIRKRLNAELPEEQQYAVLVVGDYFRGLNRVLKGTASTEEQTKFQPLLELISTNDLEAMKGGKLISDEVVIHLVNTILKLPQYTSAHGIFFDGFPRTMAQLHAIEKGEIRLDGRPLKINTYLILDVDESVLSERIRKRAEEDLKQGRPVRPDDSPEVFKGRMTHYDQFTKPLVEHVRPQPGTLALAGHVPGLPPEEAILQVRENVIAALEQQLKNKRPEMGELINRIKAELEKEVEFDELTSLLGLIGNETPDVQEAMLHGDRAHDAINVLLVPTDEFIQSIENVLRRLELTKAGENELVKALIEQKPRIKVRLKGSVQTVPIPADIIETYVHGIRVTQKINPKFDEMIKERLGQGDFARKVQVKLRRFQWNESMVEFMTRFLKRADLGHPSFFLEVLDDLGKRWSDLIKERNANTEDLVRTLEERKRVLEEKLNAWLDEQNDPDGVKMPPEVRIMNRIPPPLSALEVDEITKELERLHFILSTALPDRIHDRYLALRALDGQRIVTATSGETLEIEFSQDPTRLDRVRNSEEAANQKGSPEAAAERVSFKIGTMGISDWIYFLKSREPGRENEAPYVRGVITKTGDIVIEEVYFFPQRPRGALMPLLKRLHDELRKIREPTHLRLTVEEINTLLTFGEAVLDAASEEDYATHPSLKFLKEHMPEYEDFRTNQPGIYFSFRREIMDKFVEDLADILHEMPGMIEVLNRVLPETLWGKRLIGAGFTHIRVDLKPAIEGLDHLEISADSDKLGDGPKGASQAPVAGPAAAQAAGVSQSGTSPSIYPYIIDPNTAEISLATAGEDEAIKEEPIQFLRNIVDTKELSQNMIEGILSALFSNKKPTFAFSRKLKGLESRQLLLLVNQLNKWKEAMAQKNPKMRKLLDNFTVFTYDDLAVELKNRGIDADDKDGLIFIYEPKSKEETEKLGSAIRRSYITEPENGFPADYYYPLLEMVTLSVAKELLGWDKDQLKKALAESNITIDTLGIDAKVDEELDILIFKVMPKIKRYDNNSRIDRYTRLLQFLRSA